MTAEQQSIYAYLVVHGPLITPVLREKLSPKTNLNSYRQRLQRMAERSHIVCTSANGKPRGWVAVMPGPAAVVQALVPPNQRNVMRAPVLVAMPMQPARHGASDHQRIGSRRGDDLVLHRAPMHMCSGLPGGMK